MNLGPSAAIAQDTGWPPGGDWQARELGGRSGRRHPFPARRQGCPPVNVWGIGAPYLIGDASSESDSNVGTVAVGSAGDSGPAARAALSPVGESVVLGPGGVLFIALAHLGIGRMDGTNQTSSTVLLTPERDLPRPVAPGVPGMRPVTSDYRVEEINVATRRRKTSSGSGVRRRSDWVGRTDYAVSRPARAMCCGEVGENRWTRS